MPSDIKECSLYSFTVRGVKTRTTPKDITARAAAEAAQTTANGKQDALTAAQLAAVNSGITAEKVAGYDAFSVPSAFSGSPEMDGTASPGSANAWARGDHVHPHDTSKQDALTTTQMAAVNSGVTAARVAAWDAIEVPTKTSDLQNDSGFITNYTETDPTVPAWAKAPTKPTYTASEVGALPDTTVIPTVPTKVSAFTNDAGYLTWYTETDPTVPSWAKQATKPTYTAAEVGALPDTTVIPTVPTDISAFNNDVGYLTSYTETDPTVPAWAKASSKPTYTAAEVGAQAALTSAQMDAVNSGITAEKVAGYDELKKYTLTYTSNSYVTNYAFNRFTVHKVGPHLAILNFQLSLSAAMSVSDFVTIGQISGLSLAVGSLHIVPGQHGTGTTVTVYVTTSGAIRLYSESGVAGEWYRAMIPLIIN